MDKNGEALVSLKRDGKACQLARRMIWKQPKVGGWFYDRGKVEGEELVFDEGQKDLV